MMELLLINLILIEDFNMLIYMLLENLGEAVFGTDLDGNTLYGASDLKRVNSQEVASTDHSPIIGWAYDGNPIYGPYGYSTQTGGVVAQMKSGYSVDLKASRPPAKSIPSRILYWRFYLY